MKREHLALTEELDSPDAIKLAIEGSLDGLLEATEQYRKDHDAGLLIAGITASLIIVHQVLEAIMEGVDGDRP